MRPAIVGGLARSRNSNISTNLETSHNDSNATPTRPRALRPPLNPRDSNVMRVPAGAAVSGNKMYDKSNSTTRPLMPILSASAKTPNRTPLTPRIAGSGPSTASTPLSRRGARSENITPAASSREDLSTPVSSFLNNNITPRSGSRKIRVDSANTTPTGTPNGTPVPTSNESFRIAHDPPVYGSGLGINGVDNPPKRPMVSFSPALSDVGYKSPAQNSTDDSKFFFASEAKTIPPARPVHQSKSSSSFLYANGETIPPPQSSSGSAVGSIVDNDRTPKFFHANGTPDLESVPHFPPPRPSSVVSSSSRIASPRMANTGTFSPQQRPSSPSKLHQQASLASLRSSPTPSLESPILIRPQHGGRGQSANSIIAARKASIEAGRVSHGRSASIGSQSESKGPPVRKISGGETGLSLNLKVTSVPVSTPEEKSGSERAPADSALQSPVKNELSLEQLNELAANARRERKVLDLEITNSSLAAINRTLEREMRKQTAELRRYRRLSRSGRLSIATSASMRTSGTSLHESEDGSPLSDMSEDEEPSSEDDFSEDEESEEGSLSPGAMAESDARHRKRDEKRLQLDLTKHQQLLIDSQKMNQSLKRCLGWTEELINEGRKALEYHVRVSDIELGGRVLAPDEVECGEVINEKESEGMSIFGATLLKQARKAAKEGVSKIVGWGGEGKDDRDSGIEVDGSASGSGSGPMDSLPTSPQ